MNKCYKVVCVFEEIMLSAIADQYGFELIYELGKVTEARIGLVFVFAELQSALDFALRHNAVLECECGQLTPILERVEHTETHLFETFWENEMTVEQKDFIRAAPTGTFGTPWVKPIRKITTGTR